MNAGFSNLAALKASLLAAELRALTDFDTMLSNIGLGTSGMIEQHCNRKFIRAAGDTEVIPADRSTFVLSRYPIETITKVEAREDYQSAWQDLGLDAIRTVRESAGLVIMDSNADVGASFQDVRFTFTGGYFWETLDVGDAGYPSTQPSGSAALPDVVRLAWILQCKQIWDSQDRLGTGIAAKPGDRSKLGDLELLPAVKTMLQPFVRMSIV